MQVSARTPRSRRVQALHAAGVPATKLAKDVPENKLRLVDVVLDGDALWERFRVVHQQAPGRRKRWFIDGPLHEDIATWVLYSNWGDNTRRPARGGTRRVFLRERRGAGLTSARRREAQSLPRVLAYPSELRQLLRSPAATARQVPILLAGVCHAVAGAFGQSLALFRA
jgi:hypothetical protein